MADIKQLYSDSARSKPIYPKTVSSAVELESGGTLEEFVAATSETVEKLKSVTVNLTTGGWSDSAPYTQTVTVSGMTANWKPGIPSISKSGTVDVTTGLAELEALQCINAISSGTDTLTFICFEDKPTTSITVDVPGLLIE